MHAVDGLEDRKDCRIIGNAPPSQMVALHTVDKGGDRILQSFQKLLMALVCLTILILLLGKRWETADQKSQVLP